VSKTIQVRIPDDLKEEVGFILSEVGLTASDAINMFYKQIVLHRGIPFDIRIPNKKTIAAIEEVRSGKLESYDSIDELFKEVKNEKKKKKPI
jgi:DNA-damage-inducible protein J